MRPPQLKWHQRLHTEEGSFLPEVCTWELAARLIGELNGKDRTDVFLGYMGDEGEDRQLSVAGGNDGRYVVVVQEPERYYFLSDDHAPSESKEMVEVVVGGLPAHYPRRVVQPLNSVLAAAEHYFRTGRRGRHLSWAPGENIRR